MAKGREPTPVPLVHEQVHRDLRRRLGRDWRVGQRLPPIKDLARQLGAGQSNTQRAVQQLSREGLLASRRGRGTFVLGLPQPDVADLPDTSPSSVAGKRVHIVRRSRDGFIDLVIHPLQQLLGAAGAHVEPFMCTSLNAGSLVAEHAAADAVVLINADVANIRPAHDKQIVVIVETSRTTSVQAPGRYDHVSLNNEHGGFLAGCRLRELGAKLPCFVGVRGQSGGTPFDFTSRRRLEGLQRGLDFEIKPEHAIAESSYMSECGARAAASFVKMSPRPDAVFCASDELAVGFVHGALAHGLEAGRHFRLIGFDGQHRGRVIAGGPLTSVMAPMAAMGQRAAAMLLERFDDPDQPVRFVALGCAMLEGQTDGPRPPARRADKSSPLSNRARRSARRAESSSP